MCRDGEVVQEGYAAAAGGREEEGHTVLTGKLRKLDAMGRDQGLVGGDHVLAGTQRHGDIGIGGLDAAHDLRHRADSGIVHDRFHAGNLEGLVLLAGTHQHGAGLETRALLQHLIYADTNGAETQYCNFHCVSSSLHVRKSGTYVFRTATV